MLEPPIRFGASSLPASGVAVCEPPVRADTGHDPAAVAAFAYAIAKPGGNALLITWDNKPDGWCSIDEAIKMARAFCVEVDRDVLAADCDKPELAETVWSLAEAIRLEGLTPVVVASGRPGNLHLFARIEDRGLYQRYKEQAKATGLDVRRMIRPPLAPHRLRLPVTLLLPTDPDEALVALRPSAKTSRLSARIADLLRDGDREGRYESRGKRSTVVMAIVTEMVNRGWAFEDGFRALRDPRNRGGEKMQKRRSGWSARRYVDACWRRAKDLVTHRPAIRDRAGALSELTKIRSAIDAYRWCGNAGVTDRRVLAAHFEITKKTGKLVYRAAVRTLVERSGCGLQAVVDSNRRLRSQGWLKLEARGRDDTSDAWSLRIPRGGQDRNNQISSAGNAEGQNRNSQITPS